MQLKSEYEERLQRHNYTYNIYAAFTYDAAWSIALMLNKSIPLLREKNKTLESMSYRDKEAATIMRDMLFRTDFWGMSVCTYVMFTIPILGNFADLFFWVVLTVPPASTCSGNACLGKQEFKVRNLI